MVDLFEMHKEEMTCQVIVGVFDSAICVEPEFDALQPICVVPLDDAVELGSHDANMPKQVVVVLSQQPCHVLLLRIQRWMMS